MGSKLSSIYVLLVGLGAFFLGLRIVIRGQYNLLFQLAPPRLVNICRVVVLLLVIPIAVCVETGVAYRLGTDWFDTSASQAKSLLAIHGGIALGAILSIGYTLVAGSGLITLSILSWQRGRYVKKQYAKKQFQQSLMQKFEQAYLAEDFVPRTITKFNFSKLKFGMALGAIIVLSLLYWLTSVVVVAIATVILVIAISTLPFYQRSITGWRERQVSSNQLYEQEAESVTMLRAIPDTMLRMTQDGICMSYMPAKEESHFVLYGDIINKHISEFIAPEIAQGLIETAQLSLQNGTTELFQFPIQVDSVEKFHEARITNIGETEVLILVREIERQAIFASDVESVADITPIELHTEADLLEKLETVVRDVQEDRQNKILVCLAIDASKTKTQTTDNNNDLQQTMVLVNSSFPSTTIFLLEDDNLVWLVGDLTVKQVSALVDELHRNLQDFCFWENDNSVEFKLGLLEIDPHNSDTTSTADFAIAMVDAAKATCQMAKQKVNLKTFW